MTKKLKTILRKKSGRNSSGKVTIRHQGGRQKRFFREIDFKRDKRDIWGKVEAIEYDPNRNSRVAKVLYEDGERRYILSPLGLKEGAKIIAGPSSPIEPGNALPLRAIPAGTQVHNVEITAGKGAQMVKGAGSAATVQGVEESAAGGWILLKLPSGEIRRFNPACYASVGQVGNIEYAGRRIGKAGKKRLMGIRPTVRGTAQHPGSHPHGGGEGRSGVGLKYPKTPYGKKAVGKTRRKSKYSNALIVKGRKKGPHSSEK